MVLYQTGNDLLLTRDDCCGVVPNWKWSVVVLSCYRGTTVVVLYQTGNGLLLSRDDCCSAADLDSALHWELFQDRRGREVKLRLLCVKYHTKVSLAVTWNCLCILRMIFMEMSNVT